MSVIDDTTPQRPPDDLNGEEPQLFWVFNPRWEMNPLDAPLVSRQWGYRRAIGKYVEEVYWFPALGSMLWRGQNIFDTPDAAVTIAYGIISLQHRIVAEHYERAWDEYRHIKRREHAQS